MTIPVEVGAHKFPWGILIALSLATAAWLAIKFLNPVDAPLRAVCWGTLLSALSYNIMAAVHYWRAWRREKAYRAGLN